MLRCISPLTCYNVLILHTAGLSQYFNAVVIGATSQSQHGYISNTYSNASKLSALQHHVVWEFPAGIINSMTVQPVVGAERPVFFRERAAGMYRCRRPVTRRGHVPLQGPAAPWAPAMVWFHTTLLHGSVLQHHAQPGPTARMHAQSPRGPCARKHRPIPDWLRCSL